MAYLTVGERHSKISFEMFHAPICVLSLSRHCCLCSELSCCLLCCCLSHLVWSLSSCCSLLSRCLDRSLLDLIPHCFVVKVGVTTKFVVLLHLHAHHCPMLPALCLGSVRQKPMWSVYILTAKPARDAITTKFVWYVCWYMVPWAQDWSPTLG